MRASGASELRKIFAFSHSKTAISLNILLVLQILCFCQKHLISGFNILHMIHIQSNCSFLLLITVWCYNINDEYTDKTLTLRNVCVCERAERASLENFGIFTFLNCYFFRYFVVHQILCRYRSVPSLGECKCYCCGDMMWDSDITKQGLRLNVSF